MRYRLNKVIQQWLHNGKPASGSDTVGFSFINDFQFSEKSSLLGKLRIQPSVDWSQAGKVVVNIPAMVPMRDMAAPSFTESVKWIIEVVSTSMNTTTHERYAVSGREITYNENAFDAEDLEISFPVKEAELVIVVLSLQYTVNRNGELRISDDEKWLPAAIIGNHYHGKG
jgi:hypothetical protein